MISDTHLSALHQYFGYAAFRPLQREVIAHILDQKDALLLLPTGGGKSICFQLPALLSDGLTIVISPLISLMKDQVEALTANGIAAACLNSSLSAVDESVVIKSILDNRVKLLYLSPERILTPGFLNWLQTLPIRFFAIDEAHCISSWGHDFRPEYAQLYCIKELWPQLPILALTATADKEIREDIITLLKLNEPKIFLGSFDRPNLSLEVRPAQGRLQQIDRILRTHPDECGIIYCSSRKNTEELSERLKSLGYHNAFYHAGLSADERNRVQEDFINSRCPIIIATIAFGMGIDKSDVRFVLHYNLPKNIEGYYQEIGRAGRDGLPAETILFYGYGDVKTQLFFIDQIEDPHFKEIQAIKLQQMQDYAEAQVCRRRILLNYFSEYTAKDCGNCDVCNNPPKFFDGTRQAQMALSGIKRTGEQVGIGLLIDILRGSQIAEIRDRQYHLLKTYGVGRKDSTIAWQMYLQQMLHQGLIEIDYRGHQHLKVTALGEEVLFNNRNIKLVHFDTIRDRREAANKIPQEKTPKQQIEQDLLLALKALRKEMAQEAGKPAFTIFNDATLLDMTSRMPTTHQEFRQINGVGEYKAGVYGLSFLNVIAQFKLSKINAGAQITGSTYTITRDLYYAGKSIEEIAKIRNMTSSTIFSHLTKLLKDGENIDISALISQEELKQIRRAWLEIPSSEAAKPYFEYLNGEIDYDKIRLGLAWISNAEGRG